MDTAEEIISRLREMGYEAVFVGSAARNTHLKGDHDLDIFVFFPREVGKEEMERRILELGGEILEGVELRYADHPYVHGRYRGFEVDLVPCYRISMGERPISAVDRTPLHLEYVKSRIKGLEDEVRLLKAFMKGIGIYGAEIKVQGFSGYLCELLIIYYGGFEETLEAAAEWRYGERIDLEGHGTRFKDPLVVVDPVDPRRNVAAPVSLDSMAVFISAARKFLSSPSTVFFFPPEPEIMSKEEIKEAMERRGNKLIFLVIPRPDVPDDVLWGEIRKMQRVLEKKMRRYGYPVFKTGAYGGEEVVLIFEFSCYRHGRVQKKTGPPVFDRVNSERFLQANRDPLAGPYLENGRWVVEVENRYPRVEEAFRQAVEEIKGESAAPHLRDMLSQGEILRDKAILSKYRGDFARYLSSYMLSKYFWL